MTILLVSCPRGEEYWDIGEGDPHTYFDETMPDGELVFTKAVMDPENIHFIIPLGNLNPPGHTLPTDHIYFNPKGVIVGDVYAPANGKIIEIQYDPVRKDNAVNIAATKTITYYFGHIVLDEHYSEGDFVAAGDRLGVVTGASALDLGVMNKNISNAFINPNYPYMSKYGDAPLKYYENETLRDQLYSLVKSPDNLEGYALYPLKTTDGKFVFDKAGTLLGNWFRDGTKAYLWEEQLSFSYDCFYPDKLRIAIGRENATKCMLFAVKSDSPVPLKPEGVTKDSGPVAYQIYNGYNTQYGEPVSTSGPEPIRIGLIMVQMLSDTKLKIEIFTDKTSESLPFTGNAWFYTR